MACHTLGRQIRLEQAFRFTAVGEYGLGGQVPAADRTLHCGRPFGRRPIPGKKEIGQRRTLGGPPAVRARLRRKRRGGLFHHGGFQQPRLDRKSVV